MPWFISSKRGKALKKLSALRRSQIHSSLIALLNKKWAISSCLFQYQSSFKLILVNTFSLATFFYNKNIRITTVTVTTLFK